MNIFALDDNPIYAARFHTNRHVVKMMLEHCQMLFHAIHVWNPEYGRMLQDKYGIYGPLKGHRNHPCTLWVSKTYGNWLWLLQATFELENVWRDRFKHDKSKCHKTINILRIVWENEPSFGHNASGICSFANLGWFERTPFVLAMPKHLQMSEHTAVESYRTYYLNHKVRCGPKEDLLKDWSDYKNIPYWASPFVKKDKEDWRDCKRIEFLESPAKPPSVFASPPVDILSLKTGRAYIPNWKAWDVFFAEKAWKQISPFMPSGMNPDPNMIYQILHRRGMVAYCS